MRPLRILFLKFAKKKETIKSKSKDAHVMVWRGLLLVNDCRVFGDTSET